MPRRPKFPWVGTGRRAAQPARRESPVPKRSPQRPTPAVDLAHLLDEPLAIVGVDLEVVEWNPAMERFTGLKRQRAVGRALAGLAPVLDTIGLPKHVERAVASDLEQRAESARPQGAGGTAAWIEARCVPLHG